MLSASWYGWAAPSLRGDDVERLHHPFDRAEQAEHRRDHADDVQPVGLAIQPGRVVLARLFDRRLVIGKAELARLKPLQAGQHDVGRQRVVARVLAALDRRRRCRRGRSGPQAGSTTASGISRCLRIVMLVLDDEADGDDRHQDDDHADIAAGLDRIDERAVLDDLRPGRVPPAGRAGGRSPSPARAWGSFRSGRATRRHMPGCASKLRSTRARRQAPIAARPLRKFADAGGGNPSHGCLVVGAGLPRGNCAYQAAAGAAAAARPDARITFGSPRVRPCPVPGRPELAGQLARTAAAPRSSLSLSSAAAA